jgi:hypothetical protein
MDDSIVKITIEAYGQKQILEMCRGWTDLPVHRPPNDASRVNKERLLGEDIYETLDRMLEASK